MVGRRERSRSLADWLAWQETLHPNAIDLGLDRLQRTLDRWAGSAPHARSSPSPAPTARARASRCTARILREAGYRVGTFTSPHLLRYNERIAIDGVEVSDEALIAAFERIDAARGEDTLTFFEFNAAAALAGVRRRAARRGRARSRHGRAARRGQRRRRRRRAGHVDRSRSLRLARPRPRDHRPREGGHLSRRPAGDFRCPRHAGVDTRGRAADRRGSAAARSRLRLRYAAGSGGPGAVAPSEQRDLPAPALHGEIQYDNAAAVLAALEALQSRLPVPRSAIERGLQTVTLPGRFQVVRQTSPRPVEWILDVAHNPAAAHTLAAQLAARKGQRPHHRRLRRAERQGRRGHRRRAAQLVRHLDHRRICKALARWRRTRWQRACGMSARTSRQLRRTSSRVAWPPQALAQAGDRIVVFGSFLTVGPALGWL